MTTKMDMRTEPAAKQYNKQLRCFNQLGYVLTLSEH